MDKVRNALSRPATQDILRLHYRHPGYCEAGLLGTALTLTDFNLAGVSWLVTREWDNPLLSDKVLQLSFLWIYMPCR